MPASTGIRSYAIAALAGAFLFFATFGFNYVSGVGGIWEEGRQDLATQLIGLRYFLAEPWRLPLFDVQSLGWPAGTNIIYTDSIPIVALVAKLLAPLIGTRVNPYGAWVLLCWVLQPVAAVYALRGARVTAPLPTFCVAVMALFFPAWLWRFGHIALCGHFLLLLALGFYLRARCWNWLATLIGWSVLLAIALLVHPYLMFMGLGLFGAGLLRFWAGSWRGLFAATFIGLVVCALLIGLMYVSGHFSSYGRSSGFGFYSMNLASPFWPQHSGLFPLMIPTVDATGGQYEGFNYLGAGILGLCAAALVLAPGRVFGALRIHWPLLLVLLVFTALAASDRIYVFDLKLADLGTVPDFMQQVRATGRFFWPVGYAVLIGSAATAIAALGRRSGIVLALLGGLQLLDASALRLTVSSRISTPTPATIDAATWREVIAAHRVAEIVPTFACTPAQISTTIEQLIFAASASTTPVNSVYVARERDNDCAAPLRPAVADGALAIAFTLPGVLSSGGPAACRMLDGIAACSARWPRLSADLAAHFTPFDPSGYSIAPAQRIAFGNTGAGYRLLGAGWKREENWGVWAGAGAAEVGVVVPGQAGERAGLDFGLSVRAAQRVGVYADGVLAATWDFTAADLGPDCCTRSVTVPTSAAPLVLELRVEPSAAGEPDPRPLVIGLKSLTREAAPPSSE